MALDNKKTRIFVQIASYRDSELSPTLADMFAKAAYPERIFAGICQQIAPEDKPAAAINLHRYIDQVRVFECLPTESKGAGWARNQAQSLYQNEEYTLQIHAHMRFTQNWDVELIEMLARCPSQKPVITGWLPGYKPSANGAVYAEHPCRLFVRKLDIANDPQIVHLMYERVPHADLSLAPTPSWVGNFAFSKSDVATQFAYDPLIYFWGEEIAYSARLWTHGYDFFQYDKVVMYHYWDREGAKDNATYRNYSDPRNILTRKRMQHLLQIKHAEDKSVIQDLDAYSLGKERSLEAFWDFYGLDLSEQLILDKAKKGHWEMAKTETKPKTAKKKKPTIFVAIAAYRDPECEATVEDLFAQATYPERVSIGICWQGEAGEKCFTKPPSRPTQVRVKEVKASESKGANWARAQTLELKQNEEFVFMIDSHMRFDKGWDETLLKSLAECNAPKPVITYFPPSYDPPRKLVGKDQRLRRVRVNYLGKPGDPQLVHLTRALIKENDERRGLYPSPFVIFNCIFAPADTFREVPIDPNIHFWGDEITYSARLWTHGYKVFQLDDTIAYHQWFNRDEASEVYKDITKPANQKALKRIKHLLAVDLTEDEAALKDLDQFGHGDAESIESFWEYAGIDPWARKVSKAAAEGFWGKPMKFEPTSAEQNIETSPENARIFVQIASYRDPECQRTVKDLFEKATYPDRVSVGICWQYIADEDKDCFEIVTRPEQVRILHFDARESKGACWARHETQKLYQDEEYTLLIDAHMRFEKGWDEILINMLKACDSPKAVISSYPPAFDPPDKIHKGFVNSIVAKEFNDRGIFTMKGKSTAVKNLPAAPEKGAFVGACFLFGPGSIIRDVPYDPHLYFFGEEITLGVRLWTSGYDIYHPNAEVAYHDWERKKRKRTHFNDHKDWETLNRKSYQRVRHMLKMETSQKPDVLQEIDQYGLGHVRTLEQYQQYAGVDFARRMISDSAFRGEFPAKYMGELPRVQMMPKISEPPRIISNMHSGLIKSYESPEAVVFDNFLPEDLYDKLYNQSVQGDYKHINTTGKVSRVWNIDNGFPLRSVQDYFYYAKGAPKPKAESHYPTGKIHDQFMDHIVNINPQVSHIVGSQDKNWGHFTATTWIYPPNTGLSLHNDGAGVYSGAYVYFLNPTWRLHWGGLLMVMDGEANKAIKEQRKETNPMKFHLKKWLHESEHNELVMEAGFARTIFPKRNRIVFIAPDAYHMVTKVAPTAGDNVRMSIAGFFNQNKAKAEGKSGQ